MKTNFLHKIFKRWTKPHLTIPTSNPLSPCIIPSHIENDGILEENKGYVPVSLLINAIKDDRILNIAVAGNYGVGKSSVVNTTERELNKWWLFWKRHRFIRISLASLLTRDHKQLKSENGVTTITDKQIEYSILQQILYHEKPQETPKSRIRRIYKTGILKPFVIATFCVLTFISLVMLIKPSWMESYITIDSPSECIINMMKWGPIVYLMVLFFILCWYLSKRYTFAIDKVGYKDVEMKLKEDMSIFNAYLDEIVYFFESTKYDVVVFEDLDRFANKEIIFYKLRELNTILNNCHSFKRKINFVYAVTDHLFDSSERVKFFDYIITVIPIINSLNSYEKLKEAIKPAELFENLGRTELRNLCDYLQDMRLLLNIVNEFNHFYLLLDRNVMSEKILFGLIVYKNYLPWDFSLMYNKAGIIAGIIENADEERTNIIDGLDQEIAQLRISIETEKKNLKKRQIILREKYLNKAKELSSYSSSTLMIRIGNASYPFEKVAEEQTLFQKVREGNANFVINNSSNIVIPAISNIDGGNFDDIMAQYEQEYILKIKDLEKSIKMVQQKKDNVPNTVHEIYQVRSDVLDNLKNDLENKELADLVKFLILNGYFDRHYQYYISYFYPNALKREDWNFVMKAGRREGIQYNVRLDSLDEVLKRFTATDFSSNMSLLNVDLTRAVFSDNRYQDYRLPICRLIASNRCVDFLLVAYRSQFAIPGAFYSQVLKEYDFWKDIDSSSIDDQETLREIYVKFCDLRENKLNPQFLVWLPENYEFFEMHWSAITSKRMLNILSVCSPKFKMLSLKETPNEVFFDIIDNERYEISRKNFTAIMRKLDIYEQYKIAAYSTISSVGNASILRTVKAHWSVFLKLVFPNTSVWEREDTQCALLNADDTPKDDVVRYLIKQRNRIVFPGSLKDNMLQIAYMKSLVAPTWKNVYYYAVTKSKGLPINFLYNNVFKDMVAETLSLEEENALLRLIVFSDNVKNSKYSELVALFSTPFQSILSRIQLPKMKVLVENNMLEFNMQNYECIRSNYYSLSAQFLVNNIDSFLQTPEAYEIDKNDCFAALKSLTTKKSQCEFLKAIKERDIAHCTEVVAIARQFVEGGDIKVSEIGPRLLFAVIASAQDDIRENIGRKAILSLDYNRQVVTSILNAMGGEYKRLVSDTAVSTISYSRNAILICNYLVATGYIKACEKKSDKIFIFKC